MELPPETQPPTAGMMRELRQQAALERAEFTRRRALPEQARERSRSRTAFVGLGRSAAVRLAQQSFDGLLHRPAAGPLSSGRQQATGYASPFMATLSGIGPNGENGVAVANHPLQVEDEAGALVPMDVSLVAAPQGGWQPKSVGDPLRVAARSRGGVTFASDGLNVAPGGDDVAGSLEGESVFYPSVEADTDAFVKPTATGVEVFWQLRSAASPERLTLEVDLPEGASLGEPSHAGVAIVKGGEQIGTISQPVANDADGTTVVTETEVIGDSTIAIRAAHHGEDLKYPVVVDPEVAATFYFNSASDAKVCGLDHWTPYESDNPTFKIETHCNTRTYYGAKGMYVTTAQWPTVFPLLKVGEQGGFIHQARGGEQIVKAYTSLMAHGLGNYWNDCMQFGIYNNNGWETEPYTNCTGTGPVAAERRGGPPGSPQNRFWFGSTVNTNTPYDGWDSNFNAHMRDVEIWKFDGDLPYGPNGSSKPVVTNTETTITDQNASISARALDQSTGVASITFRGPAGWSGNNKSVSNTTCDRARCSTDFTASVPATSTMPDGQQTIWVIARDAAGNVNESVRVTMTFVWPDPDDGSTSPAGQTGYFRTSLGSPYPGTTTAVNVASGNLEVDVEEVRPTPETSNIPLRRHYNSRGVDPNSGLGPRWAFDAAGSVRLVIRAEKVRVYGPDGHSVRLTRQSDGSYAGPEDYDGSLVSTPNGFSLTGLDGGREYSFTPAGRLVSVVDREDDVARSFDVVSDQSPTPRLQQLVAADGMSVDVWYGSWWYGRAEYVFDPSGAYRYYEYDGAGRLSGYYDADGAYITYRYDANGRLDRIDFPDGASLSVTNLSDGRVTRVDLVDANGVTQTTRLQYAAPGASCATGDAGQTTVTYPTGYVTTYCWTADFHVRAGDDRGPVDDVEDEPVGEIDPDPWGEMQPDVCPVRPDIPEDTCGQYDVPVDGAASTGAFSAAALPVGRFGISDNNHRYNIAADPAFTNLGVSWLRRVVPWDLALDLGKDQPRSEALAEVEIIKTALDNGVNVVVSFERCRDEWQHDGEMVDCGGAEGVAPPVAKYHEAVVAFLEHPDLGRVDHFTAWNEPNNLPYQPTRSPERAAQYFVKLNGLCGTDKYDCEVAAGDFLDLRMRYADDLGTNGGTYLKRYKRELGKKDGRWVSRWAWHAYKDAMDTIERHENEPDKWWSRYRRFAEEVRYGDKRPPIWLTEQGVVRRWNPNPETEKARWTRARTPDGARFVMRALIGDGPDSLLSVGEDRIRMFLYYQLKGDVSPKWDSGLLSVKGRERSIYRMYKQKVNP